MAACAEWGQNHGKNEVWLLTYLGIRSGDDQVVHAHDVVLQSDGNESIDMLRNGNQNLASHVTALLRTGYVEDVQSAMPRTQALRDLRI